MRKNKVLALVSLIVVSGFLAACSNTEASVVDENTKFGKDGSIVGPIDAAKRECVTTIEPSSAHLTQSAAGASTEEKPVDGPVPGLSSGVAFGENPTISPGSGEQSTVFTRKILSPGTGSLVGPDDVVIVNYEGALWNGTVFDSSFDRGSSIEFSLNQVVAGWKWGLAGAHYGDRVELVVPAALGYGNTDRGNIPANSTLVFVVDLLGKNPVLNENQLSGFSQTLAQSQASGEKLPEGMYLYCSMGYEPQIAFAKDSKVPTQLTQTWYAKGTSKVITDNDIIGYLVVSTNWGGTSTVSSWSGRDPQKNPEAVIYRSAKEMGAVGKTVGSRLVVVGPPNSQAPQGVVQVIDIVSATEIGSGF